MLYSPWNGAELTAMMADTHAFLALENKTYCFFEEKSHQQYQGAQRQRKNPLYEIGTVKVLYNSLLG
jgi:hypothetical protein